MKYSCLVLAVFFSACAGKDGAPGAQGLSGPQGVPGLDASLPGLTPLELVNPCGEAAGLLDEVFIRTADSTLLAVVADNSNGKNPRLAVVPDGTYVTTDGDNCVFVVSGGQIISEGY